MCTADGGQGLEPHLWNTWPERRPPCKDLLAIPVPTFVTGQRGVSLQGELAQKKILLPQTTPQPGF